VTGSVRWFRALPLRSRLAMLVASAVAVAVAAVALACWVTTRDRLTEQLDSSLRRAQPGQALVDALRLNCAGQLPPNLRILTSPGYTVQLVSAASTEACTPPEKSPIPVQRADRAVAAGEQQDAVHTTEAQDGTPMRVYTSKPHDGPLSQLGAAVSVAVPMKQVTDPLDQLAIVLLVVSGIGVVGAGAAGLWVARTGLRPVDELTEAVEHVART
jgi:two-component system, OmpR family, sensor histidine kinase MprB